MTLKYRPDIDGLRAIAVLPVILYHFDIPPFTGGFIGVDIFFVISGFLITSLIDREIREGRFTIGGFYDRRIRRIAPAFILVLLSTILAALWLFLPTDLKALGNSLRAAVGMYSNIHFFNEAGYFALESARKPLLHTWSLSVEEQFYLGFPILLYVLHYLRCRRFVLLTIVSILLAGSLVKGSIAVLEGPQWAFFQTQYRLWELLTGSILALAGIGAPTARFVREAIAAAGFGLILAPIFLYSGTTPFPGLAAVPPCLGAALIIYSGTGNTTFVHKLLSQKPMVFVGLISYSLYLWHWPVVVFARYVALDNIPSLGKIALIVLVFLASVLSWRFVEKPFRNRTMIPRKTVFAMTVVAALAFVAAGSFFATNGLPDRFPAQIAAIDAYKTYDRDAIYRTGKCYLEKENWNGIDRKFCLSPVPGKFNILVLGDSHAAHYAYGLRTVLGDRFHVMQATAECAPTLPQPETCHGSAQQALAFLRSNHVDAVILSSAWQPHGIDMSALGAMVKAMEKAGTRVVVFGPSINYRFSLPSLYSRWLLYREGPFPAEQYRWPDDMAYDSQMAVLMTSAGAKYVSILENLCPSGKCPITDSSGKMLQFDGSHLTAEGSRGVIAAIWRNGILPDALGL